jgi:hypothetical protein
MMKKAGIGAVFLLLFQVVLAKPKPQDLSIHIQPTVFALTMVMIHDVANPPAASRFYTYCLFGAHEIVARHQPGQIIAPATLVQRKPTLAVSENKEYDYQLASLYCMLETGRLLLPSGYMLDEEITKLTAKLTKQGYPAALIEASREVGRQVAQQVQQWASRDSYARLSARPRYRPTRGDGYWFPTPPAYMEGIEPHWRTIEPMIIDSCSQFRPAPPTPFSNDSTSAFYRLAYDVYKTGQTLTTEQRFIASYWDCNPFAVNTAGHMSIGFKKISPGGHWMNMTSIATQTAHLAFDQSIQTHSLVAMTLMDAFISCWDEKYRSSRIRPETVINKYISSRWQPLLQTPPFPEYTSGHSVISTAAAEVLTYLLGDQFSFTDNTEILFDLPERRFSSFRQAAAEAAISRLYGGIHYRDAIENGQQQGRQLGEYVVARLKKAGIEPAPVLAGRERTHK